MIEDDCFFRCKDIGRCLTWHVTPERAENTLEKPMGSQLVLCKFHVGLSSFPHEITLLRVIPTMTFIHFLTGKSSGILSDISSGILSGILSDIPSGILSGISSGICSGISSGISSGILSGISSGLCSGISSGILSDILSGISSGILSGR